MVWKYTAPWSSLQRCSGMAPFHWGDENGGWGKGFQWSDDVAQEKKTEAGGGRGTASRQEALDLATK